MVRNTLVAQAQRKGFRYGNITAETGCEAVH